MGLPKAFDRYRPELERELRASIGDRPLFLYDMLRYHLGWVDPEGNPTNGALGKALRPMMCLLACEAVRGDWKMALPAAVSLELVHNFSLIHDDIQDGDTERRHRATVWHIWGLAQGINAGDSMRGLGSLYLLRRGTAGHPPGKVLKALEALECACLEMIEGQYLDISYENRTSTTTEEYLDMVSRKTGALMECSFYLGALLGTDDLRAIEAFKRCGRGLGLVFQIRDDFLGVWGVEGDTGKPVASDIRRKKMCLPVVYALQQARGSDRDKLHRLYNISNNNPASDKEVADILEILDRLGTQGYCQDMAGKYCRQALAELDGLDISSLMQADISSLAAFFLEREG